MVDDQIILTPEGYERARNELDLLKNVKRKEIAARIQDAKELGDLSENAEYAEAKNEQSFIEGRIIELENLLKTATVIETPSDSSVVHIGSQVTVKQGTSQRTFIIVGSNEADPTNGKISNESPLGKAFIGKKAGADVTVATPAGETTFSIVSIG
ncbi:MAG: transcription elongation factor GreA [Candidatus Kerfeldbacteria bacterium]|nr:transcription elongation factor GreA [Candidatus Kerfeldbacteria bacterium]